MQCDACKHWQTRGGIVSAAAPSCVAIEHEDAPARVLHLLAALLRVAAASDQCPACEAWPTYPDAYLSADLPLAG